MVQLSFWRPERPFVDPFCGTGTIAIEAALIGRRLAPGRNRTFAAEAWAAIPAAAWQRAREEAADLALPTLPERIIGSDADAATLKLARHHAELAGVADDIHFQQHEFAELSSSRNYGCVVTNPPYGMRMGRDEEIEALYRSIPGVLRRLKTWSHFILSARPDLEQLVGQEADRRRKLYNGRIPCTLYQFFGPKPPRDERRDAVSRHRPDAAEALARRATPRRAATARRRRALAAASAPAAGADREQPAFGGLREEAARQAEEFGNRLRKLARHLRRWPTKRGITCYRIYERDIPEVPLVVDRYEDALHIAEFDRPHDRTPAEHADWLDHMVRTAAEALETPRELVFVKHRRRQRGAAQYEPVDDRRAMRVVHEGGLKFQVNLSDYVDTGLFLDHRITRGMVRDAAAGKRLSQPVRLHRLVHRLRRRGRRGADDDGRPARPRYLDWAEENLRLNGLAGPAAPHGRGRRPRVSRVAARRAAVRSGRRRPADVLQQQAAWTTTGTCSRTTPSCSAAVLAVMRPGGVVFFSTNSRRFKFDEAALGGAVVPRDHQADDPRRLSQQANPPLLADREELTTKAQDTTRSFSVVSRAVVILSDQRPQDAVADLQRLAAAFEAALERVVLDLDAHRAVVAGVGEGADPLAPVTSPRPGIFAVLRSIGGTSEPRRSSFAWSIRMSLACVWKMRGPNSWIGAIGSISCIRRCEGS